MENCNTKRSESGHRENTDWRGTMKTWAKEREGQEGKKEKTHDHLPCMQILFKILEKEREKIVREAIRHYKGNKGECKIGK